MIRGAIGHLDVAQVVLYAFFFFFAGLIWYLRQEDRREGYPLESESMGRLKDKGFLFIPDPKVFLLASGETLQAPRDETPAAVNAAKFEPWPGAPLEPNGDPMLAGVGPGAYAQRPDVADKTFDGHDLIVPLRVATNYAVAAEGGNPLGFTVVGADRIAAGVVRDVWVDRAEAVLRYYEIALRDSDRSALVPVHFCDVQFGARRIRVNALLAEQFAKVPALKSPDSVTMLEEEKISAYFGAGTLYATPERSEPLV